MNDRDFGKLFQRGLNEHFAEKPLMDGIIQRFSVASRQDGRQRWERENPTERTAADLMKYKQKEVS